MILTRACFVKALSALGTPTFQIKIQRMLAYIIPITCSHIMLQRRRRFVAQEKMIESLNAAMFRQMVKALIFGANLAWVDQWLVNLSGLPLM